MANPDTTQRKLDLRLADVLFGPATVRDVVGYVKLNHQLAERGIKITDIDEVRGTVEVSYGPANFKVWLPWLEAAYKLVDILRLEPKAATYATIKILNREGEG